MTVPVTNPLIKLARDALTTVVVLVLGILLFPERPHAHSRQDILKIGVSSMITPVSAVKYYQEIIDYIGEQIQRPVVMVHRRSYGEMDDLLRRGEVKIAFICSMPYVRNHDEFGVELLVAPRVDGKPVYYSYIIVHKDSPIRSLRGLRGKSFVFTDPKSNTGRLYPTYRLRKMGAAPERFFSRTSYSYSHNKSVELVAKKKADGAAVDSLVYDYMAKTGSSFTAQTRIIERSPGFGIPPVVVTRDIDPDLREKIKRVFLTMHQDARGIEILRGMMIDDFVTVSDRDYDSIREMDRVISGTRLPKGKGGAK